MNLAASVIHAKLGHHAELVVKLHLVVVASPAEAAMQLTTRVYLLVLALDGHEVQAGKLELRAD
jgi:hypothetical protein